MNQPDRLLQDASTTPGATPASGPTRAALARIAGLFVLFAVAGPIIVGELARPGILNLARGTNTFFEQYKRHEPVFLVLMALFAVAAALLARRPIDERAASAADTQHWPRRPIPYLVATAAGVLALTVAGTWLVMHAFPFAMDEYVAGFQARALAEGRVSVPLASEWRQFGRALTPVFVVYDADQNTWLSAYWPIYGILRALFLRLGAERLVNPVLAAASVPLAFAAARRLWPGDTVRPWIAVGFLVLSSQFLFMSMAGFAMPAHLAINLLWVYAFARQDRAGWLAAPLIGVVALGLHNPFPHALFVAPFLLLLVIRGERRWTAYFGAVYLAGVAVWFAWAQSVTEASAEGGSLVGLFAFPSLQIAAVQELSLTVILTWQTPLLAVLLIWTAITWRSLSTMERCLAAGIVVSYGFFFLYPGTQGHGWGYRYTYPVLGNMALLGASALDRMRRTLGVTAVRRLAIASALATVVVQVPVRAWQIEHYIRPFVRAHEYVARIDADVIIVDPTASWYGIDFIRNDPFLRQRPKILSAFYLRPGDKRALETRFGDRVHLLQPSEIAAFGVPSFPSRFRDQIWPPNRRPQAGEGNRERGTGN